MQVYNYVKGCMVGSDAIPIVMMSGFPSQTEKKGERERAKKREKGGRASKGKSDGGRIKRECEEAGKHTYLVPRNYYKEVCTNLYQSVISLKHYMIQYHHKNYTQDCT